ncbi:hypothetical protein E1B28_008097 [Marasmius oreades]|uniref:Uncharacterized protein n=1 Tax=Marasmius oreades TaxID=181124 RepID=A0A9P7S4U1_9AGAR|nr:uncharacterized protein E1B28_008097 [Marasmius oreades]KAG7094498.1 hypothetical protein E1B28_008097 [Marasmius oreades]
MKEFVSSPGDEFSSTRQAPTNVPRTPAVPGSPPPPTLSYVPPFLHPSPSTPFPYPIFPPTLGIPTLSSTAMDEDTEGSGVGPSRLCEPLFMAPTLSLLPRLHAPVQPHSPVPQEDKQIWGPKTRLSARQKHPTLNLNLDLGPLIGTKHGFRARERAPGSGGLAGCEMWPGEDPLEDFRKAKESTPPPTEDEAETGSRQKRDLRGL